VEVTMAVVGDADSNTPYRFVNAGAPIIETLTLKRENMPEHRQKERWRLVPPTFEEVWPLDLLALRHIAFFAGQRPDIQVELRASISARRLKLCSLGVQMLVQDYDGHFAFTNAYCREAVNAYIRNDRVLRVPGTQDSYTFNENLDDAHMAQVTTPAKTVLFYEGQDQKPTFRYDGQAIIAFADGHVELVNRDEADELLWK
jgi:prepilin-type processing-associated H-X9-DG protein